MAFVSSVCADQNRVAGPGGKPQRRKLSGSLALSLIQTLIFLRKLISRMFICATVTIAQERKMGSGLCFNRNPNIWVDRHRRDLVQEHMQHAALTCADTPACSYCRGCLQETSAHLSFLRRAGSHSCTNSAPLVKCSEAGYSGAFFSLIRYSISPT